MKIPAPTTPPYVSQDAKCAQPSAFEIANVMGRRSARASVWSHENGFMSVVYILVIASLLIASGFLGVFIWAVRSGQFEDTVTPSMRVLNDEECRKDLDKS